MSDAKICPKCGREKRDPPTGGDTWCPLTDGCSCLQAQVTRLREHLRVTLDILDGDECQCIDPPWDREKGDERGTGGNDPAAHSQYCPVYLAGYLRNLIAGKLDPDPDSAKAKERDA